MAKQARKLTFSFENPNKASDFEKVFRKLLTDRLAARQQSPTA